MNNLSNLWNRNAADKKKIQLHVNTKPASTHYINFQKSKAKHKAYKHNFL